MVVFKPEPRTVTHKLTHQFLFDLMQPYMGMPSQVGEFDFILDRWFKGSERELVAFLERLDIAGLEIRKKE